MLVRYNNRIDAAGNADLVGRTQRDEKRLCPLAVRITAASYDGLTAKLETYAAKEAKKVRDSRKKLENLPAAPAEAC